VNHEKISQIENKKKIIKTLNVTIGIFLILLFLLVLLIFFAKEFERYFTFLFITIALLLILSVIRENLKTSLTKVIAQTIYTPSFKEKNAVFNYEYGLTLNEVMSSALLPRPDRFESNSLMKGEILGFPYKASNITLWEEHEWEDEDGHTHTTLHIIFDGRLYIIEIPFNKKGIIIKSKKVGAEYVSSKVVATVFGIIALGIFSSILLDFLSDPFFRKDASFFIFFIVVAILIAIVSFLFSGKKGYQKAKLESGKFNKYFGVQTQDQVELRKTLTPTVMEKLINLRNIIGEFNRK
jgi:hypothetical protein